MLPFKLAFLNFLDHRIFKKDYKYFHEGNTLSFSENCLLKCHWCSVFVTLEVTDQIYPVHRHHHFVIIMKIIKSCLSVYFCQHCRLILY